MSGRVDKLAVGITLCAVVAAGCARTAMPATMRSSPSWPDSICTSHVGSRFLTTTMGDSDRIRIEPASSRPRITQSQAYDAYVRRYHAPAKGDFPRMQVRYGLVTDAEEGPGSSGMGFVPEYRRTPAWVISLCGSPRPAAVELPPGARKRFSLPPDGGLLVVYLSAQPGAALLTGWYISGHGDYGLGGLGMSADNPDPAATRYRSVSWTQ